MAQTDWPSGAFFSVTVGGVAYPFKTISVKPEVTMITRSNSKYTPGYVVRTSGLASLTVTGSGPYRQGEIPWAVGSELIVTVYPTPTHAGFTVDVILQDYEFTSDVEGGPDVTVTLVTQSSFTNLFA